MSPALTGGFFITELPGKPLSICFYNLFLYANIQKMKIMASDPITSWEIDGETVETASDFILRGSKITADGDCSHEIKDAYSLEGKL